MGGEVARQARVALKPPPMPAGMGYLWQWFCELSECRGSTGFGLAPIGWQDIAAWARVRRLRLSPFEVRAIQRLDAAFFKARAK